MRRLRNSIIETYRYFMPGLGWALFLSTLIVLSMR
jgi:hypothetical protein